MPDITITDQEARARREAADMLNAGATVTETNDYLTRAADCIDAGIKAAGEKAA